MMGAAGSGKTAIALTVAEQFEELRLLAASFCFSSSDSSRNDTSNFIPTIAYQLGLKHDGLHDSIAKAVAHNEHIFAMSLKNQVSELIVNPLQDIGLDRSIPSIILLDGIDECMGKDKQDELMSLIGEAFFGGRTHFRIFVTSRPEVAFRGALEPGGSLEDLHCIRLSDDKEFDATQDIRLSLQTHLPKAVNQHVANLQEAIDAIATASSRQYIYPETVLKYISDRRKDSPKGRLKAVPSWIRNPTRPDRKATDLQVLQALDKLYRNIALVAIGAYSNNALDPTTKEKNPLALILQVFASLQISTPCEAPSSSASDSIYDLLLGLEEGTFNSVVCHLRSIVRVREPMEMGRVIQFYHRTFQEFLQDSNRAGKDLYITRGRIDPYVVKRLGVGFILTVEDGMLSPDIYSISHEAHRSLAKISVAENNG
jgi:hypothetical protein